MFKLLRRSFCRHERYWSERRHGEACYRCGHFRAAPEKSVPSGEARLESRFWDTSKP